MSWNLTKRLKETHLGSGKESRSSSTATITPSTAHSSGIPSSRTKEATRNAKPNGTSPSKTSFLTVNLVEASGLKSPSDRSIAEEADDIIDPRWNALPRDHDAGNSNGSTKSRKLQHRLPYALLEFDKNQVVIDAVRGSCSNPSFGYTTNFDVSGRTDEVSVSFFLRGADNTGDTFLGGTKVDAEAKLEEYHLTGGPGTVRIGCGLKSSRSAPVSIEAFDLLKVVGKGSFGKVMQVRKRDTSRIYALKTIRKAHIVSRSEVNHTLAERTVLAQIDNPFIVPLKFSFQSPEKLYLVLAFVNGGELFHHLQREGRFSLERSRFYIAELLIALESLHGFNVIYRDLKPENILLDYSGHIALCDFGLCKLNMAEQDKTNTFCGTPEYLAPELLYGKGYTKAVDWWTLGVLLYEMLTGLPPFYDENTHEMYRKILHDPLRFPEDIDRNAKSLLVGLLDRDSRKRLGDKGPAEIKAHPFFSTIDWKKLALKKIRPPFKPSVESAVDTSNFDKEFTNEMPTDSVVDDAFLSQSVQNQFTGWSYQGQSQMRGDIT